MRIISDPAYLPNGIIIKKYQPQYKGYPVSLTASWQCNGLDVFKCYHTE